MEIQGVISHEIADFYKKKILSLIVNVYVIIVYVNKIGQTTSRYVKVVCEFVTGSKLHKNIV